MDSSGQDYVLEHENAANLQVENAKKEKEFILKRAQEAASQELEEYVREKEEHCQEAITKLNSNITELEEIKLRANNEIEQTNALFKNNQEGVVNFLFNHVISVKFEVPDVVKGCFEEKFGIPEDY